jgi:putative ABC transport system permease protein
MRWWYELKYLIRKLNRRRSEHEVEEEIQFHLEIETRERIEAGHSPEEARYAARRAFGSVAIAKEDSRAVWGLRTLEILWQDLRYGLRMMLKRPGFTLIAIGMVAIGVAANTAVFSITDGLILRPFDFPNQDRLVMIWTQSRSAGFHHKWIPNPLFTDWQEQNQSFEQLVRFKGRLDYLTGAHEPEQVWGNLVSANFFDVLGVKAALGRAFQKGEDEPGRDKVVVLRHSFWQRRFNSDSDIIGKTMSINGSTFTIIGVTPEKFNFPAHFDGRFWTPFTLSEKEKRDYEGGAHNAFGLLKPGVSIEQAGDELSSILRKAMPPDHQKWNAQPSAQVVGMTEDYVRDTKKYLPPLIGTVAFMLLIVCANVANMLFSRALGRRQEIAVRLALGASRRRLVGQMLTESMLLAIAGGLIGLLLSILAVYVFKGAIPEEMARFTPGFERLGVNRIALLFNLLITMLTGVLFGLAPAWRSSRPNLNESLKEGRKGASSAGLRSRLRGALVIGEVALSLVLLIGAGLMLRSFAAMLRDDFGFKPANVLSFDLMMLREYGWTGNEGTGVRWRSDEWNGVRKFYDRALKRLETLPGVTAVGASNGLPMGANQNALIRVAGPTPSEPIERLVDFRVVTPGYFKAIGMTMLRGRDFTAADNEHAPGALIINEALARQFFPNQDVIGKRLGLYESIIVGIVGDARDDNLDKAAAPGFYAPFAQTPRVEMGIVLRSTVEPEALIASVRNMMKDLYPAQPILGFKTMEQRIYERTAAKRIMTVVMGVFAGIALLLAGLGLYGVMAYAVSQRTHEIGVRLALGAPRRAILRMVLGQGLKLTLVGMALGMAGSLAMTRFMVSLLYGVGATDALTFILVSLMLAGAALLACWLPARRATRVDPMIALRND